MKAAFFVGLVLCPALPAQVSTTLPAGLDKAEGTTYHWSGWSASSAFYPARTVYSYSAKTFPWGSAAKKIQGMRVRRDTGIASGFTAHSKTMRVYMSSDGTHHQRPRFDFAGVHGANRTLVVGTPASPATVDFKATPSTATPAPFDVSLVMSKPMVVPALAKNVVIDFVVYQASSTTGTWWVDAQLYPGSLGSGEVVTIGGACPSTLPDPSNYMSWPAGKLDLFWNSAEKNAPALLVAGPHIAQGIKLGSGCTLFVNPLIALAGVTDNTMSGRVEFSLGVIPDKAKFHRAKAPYQVAIVKKGYPLQGTIGLSNARIYTLGSGWTSSVEASTVYSYGRSIGNPDTVANASYLSNRVVVIDID